MSRLTLDTVWPYFMQGHSYDVRPRYVVYGGLLFQPLSLDLIEAYQPSDLRVRHFFDFFVTEQIYLRASGSHHANEYSSGSDQHLSRALSRTASWMRSTERKLARWTIWRRRLRKLPDRFVINMIGDGPPLVLDPKQVEAARERIKTRYNVSQEQNLEEQPRAARRQPKQIMRTGLIASISICFALSIVTSDAKKAAPRQAGRGRANRRQAETGARPGQCHRPGL